MNSNYRESSVPNEMSIGTIGGICVLKTWDANREEEREKEGEEKKREKKERKREEKKGEEKEEKRGE